MAENSSSAPDSSGRGRGGRRRGRGGAPPSNQAGGSATRGSKTRGQGGRNRGPGGQEKSRNTDGANVAAENKGPQDAPVAVAAGSKAVVAATDDADDGEVCFICASPVEHTSVSPCNHRTCHICALRLRALYKNKGCAHCRVSFTRSSNFQSHKLPQWSSPTVLIILFLDRGQLRYIYR